MIELAIKLNGILNKTADKYSVIKHSNGKQFSLNNSKFSVGYFDAKWHIIYGSLTAAPENAQRISGTDLKDFQDTLEALLQEAYNEYEPTQ